jgi:hypothetical protein
MPVASTVSRDTPLEPVQHYPDYAMEPPPPPVHLPEPRRLAEADGPPTIPLTPPNETRVLESPLVAAFRALLEKKPTEAMKLLEQHDQPNPELLQSLLVLTAHAGQGPLDRISPEELAALQEELQRVMRNLRSRAPLVLEKLSFCRTIEDFGVYEPLPREHSLQAGTDDQPGERVLVYGEVRNFGVQQHGSLYETALASTLEIRDFQNQVVSRMDIPTSLNRSRSPRQDYYLRIRFHIPPHLPPGRYTLWVQIRDLSQGRDHARTARQSLDLRVIEPQDQP